MGLYSGYKIKLKIVKDVCVHLEQQPQSSFYWVSFSSLMVKVCTNWETWAVIPTGNLSSHHNNILLPLTDNPFSEVYKWSVAIPSIVQSYCFEIWKQHSSAVSNFRKGKARCGCSVPQKPISQRFIVTFVNKLRMSRQNFERKLENLQTENGEIRLPYGVRLGMASEILSMFFCFVTFLKKMLLYNSD